MHRTSRRSFLAGAAGLGLAACSKAEAKKGEGAPEVTDVRFGIIALTDCSPIVIAHEKGFFKKHGINSTIVKGAALAADPRYAALREELLSFLEKQAA
jgi:nitrate/nitrite transport system substrate-binding protein